MSPPWRTALISLRCMLIVRCASLPIHTYMIDVRRELQFVRDIIQSLVVEKKLRLAVVI